MMMERLTKKVFILLDLLIVLFQSFPLPIMVSATIQPWTGNSCNPHDFKW